MIAEEFIASVKKLHFVADDVFDLTYAELWIRTILHVHPEGGMPSVHAAHYADFPAYFTHAKSLLLLSVVDFILKAPEQLGGGVESATLPVKRIARYFMGSPDVRVALFGKEVDHGELVAEVIKAKSIVSDPLFEIACRYLTTAMLEAKCLFLAGGERLFGTSYMDSQPEDQLWFLRGLGVPVLLRPLKNGRYRLIGEAFVYSYMHGEILNTCWAKDNERQITLE